MNHILAIQVLAVRSAIDNAYREAQQIQDPHLRADALVMFETISDAEAEAMKAFKVNCPGALEGVNL